MQWYDVRELPVEGRGWPDAAHFYDRLPARAEAVVPEPVWRLGRQSTGMAAHFVTDATEIHARCALRAPPAPEHSYVKYLDLYALDGAGGYRWVGASRFGFVPSGQTPLASELPPTRQSYRLYLPLGFAVDRLEVGVPDGAAFAPAPACPDRPVVIYGTSVVHGTTASRPGMCYPALLGRRLRRPTVNLGFSGSARCEPPLGRILAELDPAVFVIDPVPNMSPELIAANCEPFLSALLEARPATPMLMVEPRRHAHFWLVREGDRRRAAQCRAFRAVFDRLRAAGAGNLHYFDGQLLGDDNDDTVDGSHPSDLGFYRMAEALAPAVASLLGPPGPSGAAR